MCSDHWILTGVCNGGLWDINLQLWTIYPQNDIAEVYFIMDTSKLHFSFYSIYLRMTQIFTDFPTGGKQIACIFLSFLTFLFVNKLEVAVQDLILSSSISEYVF